jgi:hypothetical protein
MGLKTEDNCHVHNLLFADQFVITRVGDANYIGRTLEEEYEKWELKINFEKMEYLGSVIQRNCKSMGIQFQL